MNQTDTADERDAVWRALGRLPAGQRAVVVLRFFEDRTEAEAAQALGVSVSTVKTQTGRALDRLRDLLPDLRVLTEISERGR